MSETLDFGAIVLLVSAGFTAAVAISRLTDRFPVPAPALFLLATAVASDVFPALTLPIQSAERIGVVALIVILFDGGMHVGLRRFRSAPVEITVLGIVGTFATAAVMALAAHELLGFGWTSAGILGAALAPTDPAVMFSVLGRREISGRSGTILEAESGINDPVGIALMIGMLELAAHEHASFTIVIREFAVEMSVGLAIGLAGAALLLPFMRRVSLPHEALYPLRTLAFAGVIYGAAAIAHGSGFLAVFVAGLLIGDERAPHKGQIELFHTSLASLAEIVVFATLGLTIELGKLGEGNIWLDGLLLAAILTFIARPIVVGPLLLPAKLRNGERLFVMWGGLRGAVPILLGTFALLQGVQDSAHIYEIIFVVVAFSVIVQGTSLPFIAPLLGVPMRDAEARSERRYTVAAGSRADGTSVHALLAGYGSWIERAVRDGVELPVRGSLVLQAGDGVWVIADLDDIERLGPAFRVGQ